MALSGHQIIRKSTRMDSTTPGGSRLMKSIKNHLIFTTFDLQSEQNTDELYVYDGENAEGEVSGVFYA